MPSKRDVESTEVYLSRDPGLATIEEIMNDKEREEKWKKPQRNMLFNLMDIYKNRCTSEG